MRIMGLDVGDATIGIAVSDALFLTAQPRYTIRRKSLKEDIDLIVDQIVKDEVSTIVIGLPKNMNGTIGPQGEKTVSFSQKLEKKLRYSDRINNKDIQIVFWDERLTSISAERMLIESDMRREKRREVIDTVAAVYILQNYLDSLKNHSGN